MKAKEGFAPVVVTCRQSLISCNSKMKTAHHPRLGGLEILKFIGPGFLVTAGFIDPGNWASNVAAGSSYGYSLLWIVTIATVMLIFLQHHAAHLGITTGLCIAEASTKFFPFWLSKTFLGSALGAAIATAFAEILGAAIGLNMLFRLPVIIGASLSSVLVLFMLLTGSYQKLERWIIALVSLVGFSLLYEAYLSGANVASTVTRPFIPSFPAGSMFVIMSVLGAVVMPHNLFLHSEIIQSRKWNLESDSVIKRQLKYEFVDTLVAMTVGWGINIAMIIVAAAVFFARGIEVTQLSQAQAMLKPMLGNGAAIVFGIALVFAGISSSLTAAMAGASIYSGMFSESFDPSDSHSRIGLAITILSGLAVIFAVNDSFKGLLWSQTILGIQLPWTVFALIYLTSAKKVMGQYTNTMVVKLILVLIAAAIVFFNGALFLDILK
jgi:manganese transport protein